MFHAGAIPDSLALHEALESLDVSANRLSTLPAAFIGGASTARIEGAPLRNLKLSNNLFGVGSLLSVRHYKVRRRKMRAPCTVPDGTLQRQKLRPCRFAPRAQQHTVQGEGRRGGCGSCVRTAVAVCARVSEVHDLLGDESAAGSAWQGTSLETWHMPTWALLLFTCIYEASMRRILSRSLML